LLSSAAAADYAAITLIAPTAIFIYFDYAAIERQISQSAAI